MGAGFEGNVGGGAARQFARLPQRMDFGVRRAGLQVETLADNLPAAGNHAADTGIGRGGKAALCGQIERPPHMGGVLRGKFSHGDSSLKGGETVNRAFRLL